MQVLWNDAARAQPEDVYRRSFWTESFVQWSAHGSLLATIHRQGIAVWGGKSWKRVARMSHPNVRFLYLVMCAASEAVSRPVSTTEGSS